MSICMSQGASNANADGRDANGNNHSQDLDMETAENLAKACLREMPQTSSSHEWVSEGKVIIKNYYVCVLIILNTELLYIL